MEFALSHEMIFLDLPVMTEASNISLAYHSTLRMHSILWLENKISDISCLLIIR